MLENILFVSIGENSQKIVEQFGSVPDLEANFLAVSSQSCQASTQIKSVSLDCSGSIDLKAICDNYAFLEQEIISFSASYIIFIVDNPKICQAVIHIAQNKDISYICLMESNQRDWVKSGGIIANIQASGDFSFYEKVISLFGFFFSTSDIDWQELELFLGKDCYQELVTIDLEDEDFVHQLEKVSTIAQLEEASFNIFIFNDIGDDLFTSSVINKFVEKTANSFLALCKNPLIKKPNLTILSMKKLVDAEIQLDLHIQANVDKELANIDDKDLSLPTFVRKGITIDKGF